MPSKTKIGWRLSEDVIASIERCKEEHELETHDEALKLIFQRLQYLEDLALDVAKGIDLITHRAVQDPIEFMEKHRCFYRAVVKEKDGSISIYCEDKKIPKEVCITRQTRFIHMEKKCYPKGMKKQTWKKRADKEPKTRTYNDPDADYFRDSDEHYREDFGQEI